MRNYSKTARSVIAVGSTGLLIAGFGLLWSSSPRAQGEGGCSNRTLKGDYASAIDGQLLAGPVTGILRGVNMSRFDGDGHSTGVDFVTINGVAPGDWAPVTGTYEVSPDCTGQATLYHEFGPPLELRFVIGNHGTLIHSVVLGNATGSTATKVN